MLRALKAMLCLVTALWWLAGASSAQVPAPEMPHEAPNLALIEKLPLDSTRRADLKQALEGRDYTRAETILVDEIAKQPKSPELLTLAGGIFFLDGKFLNCAIAMKKAEALASLDDRSRFTLAMAYVKLDHRDWARPELEALARHDPQNALYPYWLSRLDYDNQRFTEAVAEVRKALSLDPSFMKAYDNLGLYEEALGKYDDAVEAYRQAVRLNRDHTPCSPWPPGNLGVLLVKLDRHDDARDALKESLRCDPKFPLAHYQMGLLLEKEHKDQEAIAELQQATALNPSYAEPYYALGRLYQRQGDQKSADAALAAFQRLEKKAHEPGSDRGVGGDRR